MYAIKYAGNIISYLPAHSVLRRRVDKLGSLNVFIDPFLHLHLCIFINTYTLYHHMCIERSPEWHNGSCCRPHRIKSCFTHRCFKLYTFMHSSLDNDIELSVKRSCIEQFTFEIGRKKNTNIVHRIFLRRHINIHSYSFEGLQAQVRIH